MCWARFSLKLSERKEKEGEGKKKDAQGREKHIFKDAGEGFQQCYALKPSPAPWKIRGRESKREREENVLGKIFRGEGKMGRGEEKNQGEGQIFKAEIFQIAYLTTCTFQNASASGGKPHDPHWSKIPPTCDFKNALGEVPWPPFW